jgi:hypothetical protein
MARKTGEHGLPPPECKAILLCERVLRDEFTGLFSLINVFDNINSYSFPCTIGPYLLFLHITDGLGRYRITVEIQDLQSDVVIAREDQPEIELPDKNVKWIGILSVPEFEVAQPGMYDVLVLANDQEINRQKLTVTQIPEEHDGEAEEGESEG